MTDHVYDYDWQSIYPSLIKPMCGRGSGKSQAQLQMYDAILKGEDKIMYKVREDYTNHYGAPISREYILNETAILDMLKDRID